MSRDKLTLLQSQIMTKLSHQIGGLTPSELVRFTDLDERRHQEAPNGNDGGGDWRQRTVGKILHGLQRYGFVTRDGNVWRLTGIGLKRLDDKPQGARRGLRGGA